MPAIGQQVIETRAGPTGGELAEDGGQAGERWDGVEGVGAHHAGVLDDALGDPVHERRDAVRHLTHPVGEGRDWTVSGDRVHAGWDNVVLGHIEIDGPRIVANVNSAERAARFRSIVGERLGNDARHEGTEVQTLDDALEAKRSADGPPEPADDPVLADHPEVRQRLRELMSAHYEAWVSESIPALGGLTPLEAVRDAAGREKVEALIRQIERDGLRMKPPLDPAVLEDLRRRLGFD